MLPVHRRPPRCFQRRHPRSRAHHDESTVSGDSDVTAARGFVNVLTRMLGLPPLRYTYDWVEGGLDGVARLPPAVQVCDCPMTYMPEYHYWKEEWLDRVARSLHHSQRE